MQLHLTIFVLESIDEITQIVTGISFATLDEVGQVL